MLKSEVAPVQFMFSFIFQIYSLQIYSFGFQISVGSFGATNMTKYLKLSKVTNFLWLGFDAAQKNVVFHNFFFFNFGEVFRKRNINAKMLFVKKPNLQNLRQNIIRELYPVKCILRYLITKYLQKISKD